MGIRKIDTTPTPSVGLYRQKPCIGWLDTTPNNVFVPIFFNVIGGVGPAGLRLDGFGTLCSPIGAVKDPVWG